MADKTRIALVTGGVQGLGAAAARALAEAGVEGFTRALARESAGKGITVNAIAPGYADTAMVQAVPEKIMERILRMVPLSRLADPFEIGRCVRFLAADDAGFITGATLPVNGGLRMG